MSALEATCPKVNAHAVPSSTLWPVPVVTAIAAATCCQGAQRHSPLRRRLQEDAGSQYMYCDLLPWYLLVDSFSLPVFAETPLCVCQCKCAD
jgi:hypothetical protein